MTVYLALQLDAALEAVGGLAVLAHALVAGGDAGDGALLVVEHLGGRELGVDVHPQLGCLLAQPAHQVAEADHIVAVVAHQRRHDEIGDAQRAGGPQVVEAVLGHRRFDRRALGLPVGDELVQADGIDHGAREDVRADLGALLEHDDGQLAARRRPRAASGGWRWRGPAGPAPTTTTSHSIASRGSALSSIECHRLVPGFIVLRFDRSALAKRQARTGHWPGWEDARLPLHARQRAIRATGRPACLVPRHGRGPGRWAKRPSIG